MLDSTQMEAARHENGPCLVLAGPGSGKTTVITERIRFLTQERKKPPEQILVVTFTKAAAAEMRDRFLLLTGQKQSAVTFGTFHAIFFQILKHAYGIGAQSILREEQRYTLVRNAVLHAGIKCDEEAECVHDYLRQISYRKNTMGSNQTATEGESADGLFSRIFAEYEEEKQKRRLFDLDDLLTKTFRLLSEKEELRRGWQERFQYLLVDEFQDINPIQYEIVKLLAAPQDNLFVVGDDDQSIYRFRGASPEIMLHFPEDYPACRKVLLGTNYRCTGNVVTAAQRLIRHNQNRFEKELISSKEDGAPVTVRTFSDGRGELAYVIAQLKEQRKGDRRIQTAVLFRTNRRMWTLAECLMAEDIPIRSKEHIPNPYQHFVAQDLFAYFSLAAGSRKRSDFLRVMNRPKRYLSRNAVPAETVSLEKLASAYAEKPWIAERIQTLIADLMHLRRMNPYAGVNYIRKKIGYDDFIAEYANERNLPVQELTERLDDLQETARGFASMEAWKAHIALFTKELWQKEKEGAKDPEAVTLATLHGAKGLEFDRVYLYDMNDGVMPYHKAMLPSELEEERRMVYVGMTRAKKELILLAVKNEKGEGQVPSPYIAEALRKD
ncbi:MAG: ATP-dependent helicase [Lachnospiraceae bacterium]|nr:ATP-dependent helicase [Lachnospiraceae bacterium]